MTTTTASPYAPLPQVGHIAALPPVHQPQPEAQPTTSAAGRRSFKSFVEAMDDFSFDRRDVAGMRQVLQMQEDNRRAQAAAPSQPVSNVASFAPQGPQPDVPVVRGWTEQPEVPSVANNASALPRLPSFAAGPSADLPRLPANGAAPKAASIPASELPRLQPSSGRIAATMHFAPQPATPAAADPAAYPYVGRADQRAPATANPQTSSLPPQLQSPMIDQVREASRAGKRPGVSDEMRARFAANADRRRAPVAPMPPKLMAQEARWNRDAWPASVNTPRAETPSLPTAPATTAAQTASTDLPRLPTLPTSN